MALQPDYRYQTGAPGWGRTATADAAAVDAGLRGYMLRVYNWMASGLLLTGTDVASLGIVGAMMGGVLTSAHVLGPRGFMAITSAAARAASAKAGSQTISVSPA